MDKTFLVIGAVIGIVLIAGFATTFVLADGEPEGWCNPELPGCTPPGAPVTTNGWCNPELPGCTPPG